ncbi:MAG: response regulator transcription factor [Deltaproteobacteria bacterium]|jgi:DNA-binding response OmpR family regulator|nr:response regulator transcription factor [Deltaproteobacteria bacterium]
MRVLVVEDEPRLNELISKKLVSEGYSVDSCLRGDVASDYLLGAEDDAIILDIMLPGKSGVALLRERRSVGDKTPALLLTALDRVSDRVTGLDAGAEDYLVKPFSFDELLSSLRALVRRNYQAASNVFAMADLIVDCDARTATRAGQAVSLTSKEFALLELMARNQGVALTRERIKVAMSGIMAMRAGLTWLTCISGTIHVSLLLCFFHPDR